MHQFILVKLNINFCGDKAVQIQAIIFQNRILFILLKNLRLTSFENYINFWALIGLPELCFILNCSEYFELFRENEKFNKSSMIHQHVHFLLKFCLI